MKSTSSRKKIICTVTNDLITDQRMHRIATTLTDHGFEVLLLGRRSKNSYNIENHIFKSYRLKLLFNKGFLFYAEYNFRLLWYLIFHPFDVVNAVDLDSSLAAILASRLKGKKVVLDAHEDYVESPEIANRKSLKNFWLSIERYAFRKADFVYTVGQQIANKFAGKYNREIGVIRNMPAFIEVSNNLKNASIRQRPVIIYQGAMNVGRGIPQLLEAVQPLDVELWLAGDGDLKKDILEQIEFLKLTKKVRYLGRLEPKELLLKTQEADIGINILEHLGESYYNSLANKFFDYVMAEIPQICIDFPEYCQLNGEFEVAMLIENTNPLTIRENLQNLIVNPTLIEQLTSNCRLAKKCWNWDIEEKKLKDYYHTL